MKGHQHVHAWMRNHAGRLSGGLYLNPPGHAACSGVDTLLRMPARTFLLDCSIICQGICICQLHDVLEPLEVHAACDADRARFFTKKANSVGSDCAQSSVRPVLAMEFESAQEAWVGQTTMVKPFTLKHFKFDPEVQPQQATGMLP